MSHAMTDDLKNPYSAAETYWQHGWRGLLPLPFRRKEHPPAGFTGRHDIDPSWADIQAWTEERPQANLALRLPANLIGIDVDDYDDKSGGHTLAALTDELGPLPDTWRSTSRDDGTSGIRLFTVPTGLAWPNTLGDGIDIIRRTHRYVVAAPSVHPNGGTYKWINPDGAISLDPPHAADLPPLPDRWLQRFAEPDLRKGDSPLPASSDQVLQVLAGMPPHRDRYCPHLDRALAYIDEPGARHDNYHRAVGSVVYHGRHGCPGAPEAVLLLQKAFVADVGRDRGKQTAQTEFQRSLESAVGYALTFPQSDGCIDDLVEEWLAPQQVDDSSTDQETETEHEPDPGPQTEPETLDSYKRHVQSKYLELKIVHDARQLLEADQAALLPPITGHRLTEFLTIEDEPVEYLVDGLWPAAGRVILSAAAKSGKSTLILNLLRSLADGQPFLGRFETQQVTDRIAYLNLELGEAQIRRWFRNIGIDNTDNIEVANLRGRAGALAIHTEQGRQRFTRWLQEHHISVVILDPLAPLLAALGVDENDNSGVATFFHHWNQALTEAGVRADLIAHHTGRAADNRSRGASRLDDEPDAIWTLRRLDDHDHDSDDPFIDISPRTLRAYGRDVELSSITLQFDPTTGLLTDSGETPHNTALSRRELAARRRLIEWVTAAGTEGQPFGMFGNSSSKGGPPGSTDNGPLNIEMRNRLLAEGVFVKAPAGSGQRVYLKQLIDPVTPVPPPLPPPDQGELPPYPYKGG